MIKKIISGGQVGVEQAALDVAINLDIRHGGWIPKWRREEDESVIEKYHLEEMPHSNYSRVTEQNVLDSDGTLIISQGDLAASSALNRRLAERHKRPWLYVDLNRTATFQASQTIQEWILSHRIRMLNITGAKEGIGLNIYRMASDILETVFQLLLINAAMYDPLSLVALVDDETENTATESEEFSDIPKNIDQAADILLSRLSFKEKSKIANMEKKKLARLTSSLQVYIKNEFRLWEDDEEIMRTYRPDPGEDPDDHASLVIVRELWKKLQKSNKVLKVVK
ncbi:putative molybdenum carrier protein [Desulfococcaceae bacterium HSG8]|nr:putative molybdenum carrier protein [Desulfococcaceae bacterium HSG8]